MKGAGSGEGLAATGAQPRARLTGLHVASKLHPRLRRPSFWGLELGMSFKSILERFFNILLAMVFTDSIDLSFLPVFNFHFCLWRVSAYVCEVILCHPPALTELW